MKITIDTRDIGVRTDKFVENKLLEMGFNQCTRSMIKDVIPKGCLINSKSPKPSYKFKEGDILEIDKEFWKNFFEKKDLSEKIIPQKGNLEIIYEDADILVIIKPKGLVVHPGVANQNGTLANYVKDYLLQKEEFDINMDRAGIVHRLDKGVSGILVLAKNKVAQDNLKEQFSSRKVEKIYLAEVTQFKESSIDMDNNRKLSEVLCSIEKGGEDFSKWFKASGFIGRDNINRYRMLFKPYEFGGSKKAESLITPIVENQLLIKIITGRMHQIRATLYYYGYKIVGDNLYDSMKSKVSSSEIMLKSIYLSFTHPSNKEKISFLKL